MGRHGAVYIHELEVELRTLPICVGVMAINDERMTCRSVRSPEVLEATIIKKKRRSKLRAMRWRAKSSKPY